MKLFGLVDSNFVCSYIEITIFVQGGDNPKPRKFVTMVADSMSCVCIYFLGIILLKRRYRIGQYCYCVQRCKGSTSSNNRRN